MRNTPLLALAAALALGACDGNDAPLAPGAQPGIAASGVSRSAAQGANSEKDALTQLTRITAQALHDQGLRQRLRNDLRDSRHTVEHKLKLSDYLRGQSGGILLAKMAKESGLSRDAILALVERVRPLEFYMPVARHRASWSGGDNVWVASYIEDDGSELPAVFDVNGRAVALWAPTAEPATPTLALVPVETDFTRTVDTSKLRNRDSRDGQTIGTFGVGDPIGDPCVGGDELPVECFPEVPDGPPAPGLYMNYAYGDEGVPDGSFGLKGEPEIEMHVFGRDLFNGGEARSLACSDAEASGSRYFDMNDHEWSPNIGVLLYSRAEIDAYQARTTQALAIQMWEDDNGRCEVKTGYNLTSFYNDLLAADSVNAIKIEPTTSPIQPGKIIALIVALSNLVQGNDDFVGTAQPVPAGTLPNGATHRLQRPGDLNNGRVRLVIY